MRTSFFVPQRFLNVDESFNLVQNNIYTVTKRLGGQGRMTWFNCGPGLFLISYTWIILKGESTADRRAHSKFFSRKDRARYDLPKISFMQVVNLDT